MSQKLKVLVVDDSAVFRSQIKSALSGVENVEVVGSASNGRQACDYVKSQPVDLMVLDVEMPVMNGLETLAELKSTGNKTKVILFSAQTQAGAEATLTGLRLGAADFIAKPQLDGTGGQTPAEVIRAALAPKILQFVAKVSPVATASSAPAPGSSSFTPVRWESFLPKVLVIASSTGGPNALEILFGHMKGPLNRPILIAQHMPPVFTASLATRLAKISGFPVREAIHGEPLLSGQVYIAPGDYHLKLALKGAETSLQLDQGPQRNSVRPCANYLFESAAQIYQNSLMGVVLTGMGEDGKDGAVMVKEKKGAVLIQDKASCIVFGMPGAVKDAGAYDQELTLSDLAQKIAQVGICSYKASGGAAA